MPSAKKQQKRAKRAKTKAKQARVERQDPALPTPIVPDYFMPDFLSGADEEFSHAKRLDAYLDPELLEDMDDEEREAMRAILAGNMDDLPSEEEMLLMEVYLNSAPEPSQEQRLAHFEALKQAETQGQHALLMAFAKGPVAAHALHNIDIERYDDILINTLGAYWAWAHGLDEATVRARVVNDAFHEAFLEVLGLIEEESILQTHTTGKMKGDESDPD